jgi:Argonaute linker 1 domain
VPHAGPDGKQKSKSNSSSPNESKLSRTTKKFIIGKLIANCDEFSSEPKCFQYATDFVETIVSWTRLWPEGGNAEVDQIDSTGDGEDEDETNRWPVVHTCFETYEIGHMKYKVSIKGRLTSINLNLLKKYVRSELLEEALGYDPNHAAKLLNIFVSRHVQEAGPDPSLRTEKIGSKYFLSSDYVTLSTDENRISHAFYAIQGFFTNVVIRMRRILLNVNTCTGAFFKPVLVSEFLHRFDRTDYDLARSFLRGVKVYIETDRKDPRLNLPNQRVKTIVGLGLPNQTFTHEKRNERMEVRQYLKYRRLPFFYDHDRRG